MPSEPLLKRQRNAQASSMPTFSTLPVRLCLRSLMNVSVIAVTLLDAAVEPDRGVDAVGQQVAGDAAAGGLHIEPPQAGAALRQIGGDRPVLQELGAVMKDACRACRSSMSCLANVTAGTRR